MKWQCFKGFGLSCEKNKCYVQLVHSGLAEKALRITVNKNPYNESGVGMHLVFRNLQHEDLKNVLRSEAELKTKPTHSDSSLAIKAIMSLLYLSVLFFQYKHWSKTTSVIG